MASIKDRTGETNYSYYGQLMTIVKYRNATDLDVMFEDGTVVEHKHYRNFVERRIRNPNRPSVYNIGYMGIGEYNTINNRRAYEAWEKMFQRCYSDKKYTNSRYMSYQKCEVDPAFYNFQLFCQWFNSNIWNDSCTVLDKDILVKHNKIYSPDNCVLVDDRINCLFTFRNRERGNCPLGVRYNNKTDKYIAQCNSFEGKRTFLGAFSTSKDAFQCYKQYKEHVIKSVADDYKLRYSNFPDRLYEAMYKYSIDYDD